VAAAPPTGGKRLGEELPATGFLLLAGLTLFWGANWPAMKIALDALPVWTFRSVCLVGGGLGLLLLARLGGRSLRVPERERAPLALVALFNVVGWHLCSGYGVSLLPASRAVIVAFTMPLWATLFSCVILGEPLTRAKLTGLALGMAGLAALIGPDLKALGSVPLGAVMMLGAAISWAAGTVLIKRFTWTLGSAALAGWQLLLAAVPIVPGALLIDGLPDTASFTTPVLLAVAYVLLLPMIFCQWAYFQLVRIFPAGIAAIGTLAIPAVGVFSSALILGEALGLREFLALGLVCTALGVVLLPSAFKAAAFKAAPPS
jgi:drug/metabolite transporter (DMT)-like permease